MKFSVLNLGCRVNRVESDFLTSELLAAGATLTVIAQCDVVIINTCTVTGEAEKKTRKAVRRALRDAQSAFVIVTGCAASLDPDTYLDMDIRVLVESDKTKVVTRAFRAVGEKIVPASKTLRLGSSFPTRVGIKVQDGCNNACTYCIVCIARGRSTSRCCDEVVAEVVRYARLGVREFVLTGINLGSYCDKQINLVDLLVCLLTHPDTADVRFRLSSIEPCDVDDDLINLMAENQGRICRHLHLPLQSGSDRVLREMGRPYTSEYFTALVEKLYAVMPAISISTDIIVGFPGEEEKDFQETIALAQSCRFSRMHVFPYSQREGTIAASRYDQVAFSVKADRAKRLRQVGEELRRLQWQNRLGTTEAVLVEVGGMATTESYFSVSAPEGAHPGDLIDVSLLENGGGVCG